MPFIYNDSYSYKKVVDMFQDAFKKYMLDPNYSGLFVGMTPAFVIDGNKTNINDYKKQSGNAFNAVTGNIEIEVDFVDHHSEYILRLLRTGRLRLSHGDTRYTYHDPCELGRGSGIYDQPRAVIEAMGQLLEPAETRENALCCGSSVANTAISDGQQAAIARSVAAELEATGAETIVTACPLCKKAIARGATKEVHDLAEIVAAHIRR